jgi:hypothetical protein
MLTGGSGSKGSEAYPTSNTLIKGTGNHTVKDSSIVDNGTNVTTNLPISASGGITGSLNGNADTATTATTASYVNPLNQNVQITGSLNITGSARNASKIYGNLTQQLDSPGLNNQYDLITIPSTTVDGQSYTNVNNFFADYSGFGQNYKDYFAIEYYDSFGYNYGSEFAVNGVFVNMSQNAGNSQTAQIRILKKAPNLIQNGRGSVTGSSSELRAAGTGSQVQIWGYSGAAVDIKASGNQGGSTAYMKLSSDSDITLNASNRIIVTGSIVNEINALSIASNTASLDCQDGDMFTLTLVSGSNTHLNAINVQQGQTISLKVLQPSTATDSYGTMTFESEFAFAGGTAPTITAASGSTDILTFQSYDASTLFGTAVQNLS